MSITLTTESSFKRGDLLEIDWLDYVEDPTGDPRTAKLERRTSFGMFWEVRYDGDVQVLVTTTTKDEGSGQEGYCIYPLGLCKITIIKRARKRAVKQVPKVLPAMRETDSTKEG